MALILVTNILLTLLEESAMQVIQTVISLSTLHAQDMEMTLPRQIRMTTITIQHGVQSPY